MRYLNLVAMMVTLWLPSAHRPQPSERIVPTFAMHGNSRLAALAKIGSLTNTSLLVEAGDMPFLQEFIELDSPEASVRDAVGRVLGAKTVFGLRNEGNLLIVSTAKERDRMLLLPLGRFRFAEGKYSALEGPLAGAISVASGCPVAGWAWAGGEPMRDVPRMDIAEATFESIVARVADSTTASMWILQTRRRPRGCINRPDDDWQFGTYGFGAGNSNCQMPFASTSGPEFLRFMPVGHAFQENCNVVPRTPPPF